MKETQFVQQLFVASLQDAEGLERPVEGPKSSRPPKVAKKDRRTDEVKAILARAQTVPRNSAIPLPAAVPEQAVQAAGAAAARPMPDEARAAVLPLASEGVAPEIPGDEEIQEIVRSKCLARVWGPGLPQCLRWPHASSEFCGRHDTDGKRRAHGRIDEAPPPEKAAEAKRKIIAGKARHEEGTPECRFARATRPA